MSKDVRIDLEGTGKGVLVACVRHRRVFLGSASYSCISGWVMELSVRNRKREKKVSEFFLQFLACVFLADIYFINLELNSLMPKCVRLGHCSVIL